MYKKYCSSVLGGTALMEWPLGDEKTEVWRREKELVHGL